MFIEDKLKEIFKVSAESIIDVANKEDLKQVQEITNILPPVGQKWLIRIDLGKYKGGEIYKIIKRASTCVFLVKAEFYKDFKYFQEQMSGVDNFYSYYASYLTKADYLYLYDTYKSEKQLTKVLFDYVYQSYNQDIEALFLLFDALHENKVIDSRKKIAELCGIGNNSIESFMFQLLKPITGSARGLKTVLRTRIQAGIDLGNTLTYPTFYSYLKNTLMSCIEIKMLQISGIIYKEIKDLPDGYDEKKLSKYQRHLWKITDIPMTKFLNITNIMSKMDRWNSEMDFIQFIYKVYDAESKNILSNREIES